MRHEIETEDAKIIFEGDSGIFPKLIHSNVDRGKAFRLIGIFYRLSEWKRGYPSCAGTSNHNWADRMEKRGTATRIFSVCTRCDAINLRPETKFQPPAPPPPPPKSWRTWFTKTAGA